MFNPLRSTVACLALLLTLATSARAQQPAAPAQNAKPLPADLAIVPADTVMLIALTLGDSWNGAESESLTRLSSVHPLIPSYALKDLPANLGVESDNIERLMQLSVPGSAVSMVATRQPYDREKVLSAFVPEAVEKSAGDKSYFHSQKSGNSVQLVDDRTLLLGLGEDLQAFISRPASPKRNPYLDTSLRAVQDAAPFVVFVGPDAIRSFAADQNLAASPYAAVAKAQALQLATTVGKDGLTINLLADFATPEDAANSTAALKSIVENLASFMPVLKQNMVPFLETQEQQFPGSKELVTPMTTAIDATAESLKAVRVGSQKTRAGAQVVVKTDAPLTTALMLLTLTPRAQK